jgi:hypothetical protein
MIDPGLVAGEIATPAGLNNANLPPPNGTEPLDVRVSRLENAVAQLQDTKELEDRVAERVARRLKRNNADATGFVDSSKHPMPPPTADDIAALAPPRTGWLGWTLFLEMIHELRLIGRLYFDRRYRPTWLGRIAPPVILVMILLSYFWIPFSSIMPRFIETPTEKIVDLLLAFVLIKILVREVNRYRLFLMEHSSLSHS